MPTKTNAFSPRKTPRQSRSQATFDAVLEAAAHILNADGAGEFTTNAVAARAGVSIGSLYQYFPTKEAIIAELIRAMRRDMHAALMAESEATRGLSLDDVLARMIHRSIAHHMTYGALADTLEQFEASFPPDPEVVALKREIEDRITDLLTDYAPANPRRAAFDITNLVVGMVHPALQRGETDYDALVARVARAAKGYLTG